MKTSATVVCVRGRYTTYLDRETASLFYYDEVLGCKFVYVHVVASVLCLVNFSSRCFFRFREDSEDGGSVSKNSVSVPSLSYD